MRTPLTFLLMMSAVPVMAQDTAAIQTTIDGQMAAFTARDVSRAFDFASPNIQRIFNSATNFGQMVEHGYPMVWNNADTRFLSLRQEGPRWVQRVLLTDQGGAVFVLEYYMIETEGGWLIDGVDLMPAPEGTA